MSTQGFRENPWIDIKDIKSLGLPDTASYIQLKKVYFIGYLLTCEECFTEVIDSWIILWEFERRSIKRKTVTSRWLPCHCLYHHTYNNTESIQGLIKNDKLRWNKKIVMIRYYKRNGATYRNYDKWSQQSMSTHCAQIM